MLYDSFKIKTFPNEKDGKNRILNIKNIMKNTAKDVK